MLEHIINILKLDNFGIGQMPEQDNFSVINYSGGQNPIIAFNGQVIARRPGFQIRVRNVSFNEALKTCEDCIKILNLYHDEYLKSIRLIGDINNVGRDEKNRYEFTLNFETIVMEVK